MFLEPGEVRDKTGAESQQGADATLDFKLPVSRAGCSGEKAEQRAFSRAVVTDHADGLTTMNLERNVAECPVEVRGLGFAEQFAGEFLGQERLLPGKPIGLRNLVQSDDGFHQTRSANSRSCFQKVRTPR